MAFSSTSRIETSVCLDSASSPVNMALKYGEHAAKMTLERKRGFVFHQTRKVDVTDISDNSVLVGENLLAADDEDHVAEVPMLPDGVQLGEGLPGVLLRGVGHPRRTR